MPNIYLKVTTEKNQRSRNFDFLSLKNLSPGQFLGSSYSCRYNCVAILIFWFWKELWRFKVKESMHFVEQKYKL